MMPPCCFTPAASPFRTIGTVTRKLLVHRNALQVDVQQLALDRLILPVDDHRLGPLAAFQSQIKNRVVAALGVQDRVITCRGSTATDDGSLPAP